jgi:hypothetical protein
MCLNVEVHHLTTCVHASIGPASGCCSHGLAGKVRKSPFQDVLNGAAARLRLPAMEPTAVVFDA